jgi:hypothetical protein
MERRELRGHSQHRVSMKTLRRQVRRTCKLLGVVPPTFKTRSMSRYGIIDTSFDPPRMTLDAKYGRNFRAVAHELAHHIVWMKYGERAQDHGPTWVSVYTRILHCWRVVPEEGMRALCRKYGIRYR